MPFDAQAIFANLAEKERVKGHHSAEGRAIRTLSRALSGWSAGDLARRDVIVLCEQAVEDWLKGRLRRSPWSARTMPALLVDALKKKLISRAEALRLQRIHHSRVRADASSEVSAREIEAALEFCLELIDKHW
ncbi:MAG: hypothetical protein ACREQ2_08875 [Candidatus Binatia bacterium]